MEAHASTCADCNELLKERKIIDSLLKKAPKAPISAREWSDIEANIFSTISSEKEKEQKPLIFRLSNRRNTLLALAASLLMAVTLFWHMRNSSNSSEKPGQVTVAFIQGSAIIENRDTRSSETIQVLSDFQAQKMPVICKGTVLETPESSAIGFRLDDLAEVTLSEKSRVELTEANATSAALRLENGAITLHVDPEVRKGPFTLETENALCTVTGTIFKVTASESLGIPITRLSVSKGCVKFSALGNGQNSVSVSAGHEATITGTAMSSPSKPVPPEQVSLLERFETSHAPIDTIGYLHVVTIPPACSLFAEERFLGLSPLFIALKSGPWALRIQKSGYENAQEPTLIRANESSRMLVVMRKNEKAPALTTLDTMTARPIVPQQPSATTLEGSKTTPVDTASELYQTAKTLISKGRFSDALPVLQKCALQNPICRMWLSRCHEELHNYDEAIVVMNALATDNSAPIELRDNAQYSQINLYLNGKKDAAKALIAVDAYTSAFPEGCWSEEAAYEKARINQLLSRHKEAAQLFEAYVARFPKGPRTEKALNEAAMTRLNRLSDPVNALKNFEALLALNSNNYSEEALFWKAQALYTLGKSVDALSAYREYLGKYPKGRYAVLCNERMKSLYSGK